jgi:hypothetical protein
VPSPRTLRPALLAGAALAVAATALLAPASAASKPAAVKGGITQAYQATYYVPPTPPVIPSTRYYLSGTSSDDTNKLTGRPTATITATKPTATTDITQSTNVALANGGSDDTGSAFWTGPYKGAINGKVQIHWFWATHDAAAANNNLTVHVFADPGTPKEKQIGSGFAGVTVASGSVVAYTATVDVLGTVGSTLQISAEPRYIDASNDLVVHYGSTTALSYVDIPKGPPPVVKIPTTQAVKDTNPLVVSSTYIGRKAAEPTLGVTPKGNAFVAAADFDGISPATPRTLIYGSDDGNKSWHNVSPLVAGQPTPPTTADPYLYVDPVTGRIFNDDLTAACSFLQWSDDEGKTWSMGNPLACESPVDDHQTVVTGVPPAGITTTGYPRVVYYCVNKVADVSCARSTDGGSTFTITGAPAYQGVEQPGDGDPNAGSPAVVCGGLHGHIITDPGGRLYVPKGHCDQPWVSISADGGTSWTQVRVNKMLVASHQTSIASDTAGNLYYTWFGQADDLPYMAVSKDHGQSWGPAVLIAPPGVTAVNYPSIDVQAPGHLVMSFPGTTGKSATAARPWNYYVAVTTDALSPRPTFHSTTANAVADPIHRGPCLDRCAGMYDFIDVVVAPKSKELWAAGVDTCTSAGCKSASGTTLTAAQAANDAQGFVVRQLSGPGLKVVTPAATPVKRPVVTPTTTVTGGGSLPATGLGVTVPVVALLAVGFSLLLRRRTA